MCCPTRGEPKRQVHFGSNTVRTLYYPNVKKEELWYTKNDMQNWMRKDIIEMLNEYKLRYLRATAGLESVEGSDTASSSSSCHRGLEAYVPGANAKRKQIQMLFSSGVIEKYRFCVEICDLQDEIEEELEFYASSLSQPSRRRALQLGDQDATEAHLIYREFLKEYSYRDARCVCFLIQQIDLAVEATSPQAQAA